MKLTPPRLVVAVAAPEMNSNAKRSMQATVQYSMRGSIIKGRLYTIGQTGSLAIRAGGGWEKTSYLKPLRIRKA